MRLATWNVNSVRSRVPRITDFLTRASVDVLAMQEIKCTEAQFPRQAFEDAGYEVALHGLNQWNGVAIASRHPIEDVEVGFPGMPAFGKEGVEPAAEARAIGATTGGLRVWSLYVPNGRGLGDPHYDYKLEWLAALTAATAQWTTSTQPLALTGDFNIAPLDSDVGDPSLIPGLSTHISPPERAAFEKLLQSGVSDVVRPLIPTGYTYWDYKQLRFPRNEGLRIDFVLGSQQFADAVTGAKIHRDERKGDAPSDHVPVVVDVDLEPDDDDERPMFY